MIPKLAIILGPTAAGKSAFALELAGELDGEIVNADSQQVYRRLEIGTGKPSKLDRARIKHHVVDVVDPDEEFNVAIFLKLALEAIGDISSREKKAVICGGTGLYIKALTQGLFTGPVHDTEIRTALGLEAEKLGWPAVYERLKRIDPAAASSIHPHDRQRIIRALEVFQSTGIRISQWQQEHGFRERRFEAFKIGFDRPRDELYRRIDRRCDEMVAAGLLDEVRDLAAQGYPLSLKAMASLGYRHMGLFLSGALRLEEAVTLMKRDTRRLAKRQLTWFRRDPEVRWFHPEKDRGKIVPLLKRFLA